VNTVGKTEWEFGGDPPGMHVRSVVSVGMLNEGWDAQNVTQILGLRAFTSQLLCEQVVGRGLRRMNYDDFSDPEYVDVYGIPFEVFPVKRKPVSGHEKGHVSTLVQAVPERKHLEIVFPRVEGYIYDVRLRLRLNIGSLPYLKLDPFNEPTEVLTKPATGYDLQRLGRFDFTQEITQNRNPFHEEKRLQGTVYEIAAELTSYLSTKRKGWEMRHVLFPQVLTFVWKYLRERVVATRSAPMEETALLKYKKYIVERLAEAIEPDTGEGEPPILPVVERFRPLGSTSEVLFRTSRLTVATTKSHVSHVVLDSMWERDVALQLEQMPQVISYVRNDHMDFVIPYEWDGVSHVYVPDFIVECAKSDGSKLSIVLEVKGFESEKDRQKETAAKKWVRAVNYDGGYGEWAFVVNRDPGKLWETITNALEESMRLM
jgi:type III restriction enzyme